VPSAKSRKPYTCYTVIDRRPWAALTTLPRMQRWLLAAACALAIALLNPRISWPGPTWRHVVVLDITQSMNTVDAQIDGEAVSRLAFARRALRDALSAMPCGSKLGFAVFSEYRTLLLLQPVEVCANYGDLPEVIARIDGRMSWAGASEVGKGVGWALRMAREMEPAPSLVFITDGHEAPPLRPGERPRIADDATGRVKGVIAGVGGDMLKPIPKRDVDGGAIGFWGADDVLQTDPMSLGRTQEGAQQTLVDETGAPLAAFAGSGTEHLSSLKEPHLRELAQAAGLGYRRLTVSADLSALLLDPALATSAPIPRDLRWIPLLIALVCLCAAFVPAPRWRRQPVRAETSAYIHPGTGASTVPGAPAVEG
jgi:mxaL protein